VQYIVQSPAPTPTPAPQENNPVNFLAVENTIDNFVEDPELSPGSKKVYLHITKDSMHKFYTEHNPENVPRIDAILQTLATNQILSHCNDKYSAVPETTLVASVPQDHGSPEKNSTMATEGKFKFLPGTITRQSLITYYQKYCPEKVDDVDEILAFYDPGYLLRTLHSKYGVVPDGSYVVSPEGRPGYTFRAGRMKNEAFLPVNEEVEDEGVDADCLPRRETASNLREDEGVDADCLPQREATPVVRRGKKSQEQEAYYEPADAGCL
jgi:hypothetical protein